MKSLFPYLQFIEENNASLGGIKKIYLYPGMEFRSELKWWPDEGVRPTFHEGVDICYYSDSNGYECSVTPEFQVPVMADGGVFMICKDYLGYTVFLDHGYEQPQRFLSIYAHIIPCADLNVGDTVRAGSVIGTVADTTGRKNRMPAHLHISIMNAHRNLAAAEFNWDLICYSEEAELVDPLNIIVTDKIQFRLNNHWKAKFNL